MDRFPLIISFYTKGTPYEDYAASLKSSCDRFKLETDIEGVDSKGSWELNCAFKPFFILNKIEQHKRGVIWVDADALFMRKPAFIPHFRADLAVRVNAECPCDHDSKINSGTIYANFTPQSLYLLGIWAQITLNELTTSPRKREFWDQISLREAIYSPAHAANIAILPISYLKIYDHPGDAKACKKATIVHYQASRLCKIWPGA